MILTHHLPEYSEILSMLESHSQMGWTSQPGEPGWPGPRSPGTHKSPFSKHHAQSRHLLCFVEPKKKRNAAILTDL